MFDSSRCSADKFVSRYANFCGGVCFFSGSRRVGLSTRQAPAALAKAEAESLWKMSVWLAPSDCSQAAYAYWLIAFAHQARFYILWPMATTAFFVWLHRVKWKSLLGQSGSADCSREEKPRNYRATFPSSLGRSCRARYRGAGLFTAILHQSDATAGWHHAGSAIPDVFLHIAIANELTHTVPPQSPVFFGHPLTYHYGMDLVVAMFANATGLGTPDLTLRFVPTLFLALSMLNVFCFSRTWLGSGYFAVLVGFRVFFGEDFSFIPGLLQGVKGDWSMHFFSAPAFFSLFYTNPMLPGVGSFLPVFFVYNATCGNRGAWLFLSAPCYWWH